MSEASFHYIFEDNQADQTLVLLHGTGGDEHDLLPIGRLLGKKYNLLGLRGNVKEQGMSRFFVRTAAGVFDRDSIDREVAKLKQFLTTWLAEHNQTVGDLVYLGFSNGANMILALVFSYPELVKKAVLLHPMLPFTPEKIELNHASFLVTMGQADPMVSLAASQELVSLLLEKGAKVESVVLPGGHQISAAELGRVASFLD